MKVDLCDLKRMLRADFFAKDRDVTLQSGRSYYSGGGELASLPDGAIVLMFSGAVVDIPTGWQLADGTNGTSDLVDMFVVGAGNTYNPGDTGGATTHTHGPGTLNTDSDSHTHGPGTLNTDSDTHTHSSQLGISGATAGTDFNALDGITINNDSHDHDVDSGVTASDSHDHDVDSGVTASADGLPPYYALCFIMRPT